MFERVEILLKDGTWMFSHLQDDCSVDVGFCRGGSKEDIPQLFGTLNLETQERQGPCTLDEVEVHYGHPLNLTFMVTIESNNEDEPFSVVELYHITSIPGGFYQVIIIRIDE